MANAPISSTLNMPDLRVSMVAAERSGDMLAALLLQGMHKTWPLLRASGIGGPLMNATGFVSNWSCDELSVRGLVEALWRYRHIHGIRQALIQNLLDAPPHLYVGVDASDFNLPVERLLRQKGVPTVQLVCPSIWAWRPERVQKIRDSVDHVLCIYPFEPELLAQHGIAGTFVGHPVADVIALEPDRSQARLALGLPSEATIVALLPGSRPSEVKGLAIPFLQAAQQMLKQRPGLQFVLPTHELLRPMIEAALVQTGMLAHVHLVMGRSHEVQAACDVALVASGTATLETALHKRPMVIAYKMQWLSWQIANRQRLLPWIGLPNILCNDGLVPEFLQEQVQPKALADAVLRWLDDPVSVAKIQRRFADLHLQLRRDMPTLATHAIQKVIAA
ncbi:lipid-A-disaccharide synthase [Limnohabitans sp. DCL3]|uniref:lipid-A-disaccharide synthase n=1 Tax=Limnohabitans sp. DCL3 TaxID=3374103 RepID=UPI003A89C9B5